MTFLKITKNTRTRNEPYLFRTVPYRYRTHTVPVPNRTVLNRIVPNRTVLYRTPPYLNRTKTVLKTVLEPYYFPYSNRTIFRTRTVLFTVLEPFYFQYINRTFFRTQTAFFSVLEPYLKQF